MFFLTYFRVYKLMQNINEDISFGTNWSSSVYELLKIE